MIFYWFEYTDVPAKHRTGPLGVSAVRHENHDLVHLSAEDVRESWDGMLEHLRKSWEERTGRPIAIRREQ